MPQGKDGDLIGRVRDCLRAKHRKWRLLGIASLAGEELTLHFCEPV